MPSARFLDAMQGYSPIDQDGRGFDFHGLRHQFITNLAAAGVHPKAAQMLARHSTITLTMDRYTHLGLVDQTAALDKLPTLPCKGGNAPEVMKATGTDGALARRLPFPCRNSDEQEQTCGNVTYGTWTIDAAAKSRKAL